MRDFKRGGGGYDRGGRGGRDDRGFDRGGRGGGRGFDKQMFSATCADCGDRCEVPFRPTGEKPVLCNTCFRGGDDRGGRPQRRNDRPRRDERPSRDNRSDDQLEQINAKLDVIMKEIEKLKQPGNVHTVDSLEAEVEEVLSPKAAKKAKKAKKEAKEEVVEEATEEVADEKPAKKAAKKTTKKAEKKETTKKPAKKAAKK